MKKPALMPVLLAFSQIAGKMTKSLRPGSVHSYDNICHHQRMNERRVNKTNIGRRLWNAITKGWVADVPDDIACCEFKCRVLQCTQGQWESCENRLRYMAMVEEHRTKGPKDGNAE